MKSFILLMALLCTAATTAGQTGFPPFGSFQNGSFDVTNLQNLNTVFTVPIVASRGRGLALTYSISYNSLNYFQSGAWYANWTGDLGWQLSPGFGTIGYSIYGGTCETTDDNGDPEWWPYEVYGPFWFWDAAGTLHSFDNAIYIVDDTGNCGNGGGTLTGRDSTGYYLNAANILSNGNISVINPSGTTLTSSSTGVISTVTDSNGNMITSTVVNSNETDWKDSAGRVALKIITSGTTSILYEVLDTTGAYQTTTVNLQTINIKTNFNCPGVIEYTSSASVPSTIVLPNSKSYSITYEPNTSYSGYYTGRVQRVALPTGGYYEYDYPSPNDGISCSDGSIVNLKRQINDGTNTAIWQYGRTGLGGGVYQTTVTAPAMTYDTSANQADYIFNSNGQETNESHLQGSFGSGSLLREIDTIWATDGTPATRRTILSSGLESETDTTYDNYGNLTQITEYDWATSGPGALLRTTSYAYVNGASYLSANLLNLPTQKTILDGSGTRYQEAISYDGTVPSCVTGAVQHDDADYGCSLNVRGNPTLDKVWRNTDGAWLSTTLSYNTLGDLLTVTDANSHSTVKSYADSWANSACSPGTTYAYPTSVTDAASHATTYKYFPCTGDLASTTDQNGQTTSYSYDYLRRPSQITFPDGGQTGYSYNDVPPVSITVTKKMTSTQNYVQTQVFDGVARPTQGQINSSSPVIYSDTSYDLIGRVASISNPHFTAGSPTDGVIAIAYDGLSRVTKTTDQDGSVSSNSYLVNCETQVDENSIGREKCSNGVGQPTQVFEDPGSSPHLNYETDYSYDGLGNLLQVTQKGGTSNSALWRSRSFTYNSLSQPLTVTTPEAGSVCFGTKVSGVCQNNGYDAAGNLLTRTDARGVVTSYAYDAVNRITSTTYSDGTPNLSFSYDTAPPGMSGLTNLTGRLVEASNQYSGMSGSAAAATVISYDPMGRIKQQWQQTPLTSPGGNSVSFSYDLMGDLITKTDALNIGITQNFNSAGLITSVTSSFVDSNHPATLATVSSYYPTSQVQQLTFGNGLVQYNAIQARLQTCEISLGTAAPSTTGCGGSAPPGNKQTYWQTYGNSTTTNNGSISKWQGSGQENFTRIYGYDSLNRLNSMSSSADYTGCTGLSWSYDAWGNRASQTVTGGTCPSAFTNSFSTNTNRLDGYSYDAAGNLLGDGVHTYAYDAENRVKSVDGGSTATYIYDALGRRVQTNHGSWKMEFYYDTDSKVVDEWDQGGMGYTGWYRAYAYLGGQMLVQYQYSTTYFALLDHLGSTRLLTEYPTPGIYDSFDSTPFGDEFGGTSDTSHKFTGFEHDSESNLDHTLFRQYAAFQGRWLSPDPQNAGAKLDFPQTWNGYTYAANNPLNIIDPSGKDCIYLDPEGTDVEEIDTQSNSDECRNNGGAWVNGTVDPNSVVIDPDSNWISADNSSGLTQFTCDVGSAGGCSQAGLSSFETWQTNNWGVNVAFVYQPGSNSGTLYSTLNFTSTMNELENPNDPGLLDVDNLDWFHWGYNDMRQNTQYCSIHLNMLNGSGQGGAPTTGIFHVDFVHPWLNEPMVHGLLDLAMSSSPSLCH